jgi:hypothetical protein
MEVQFVTRGARGIHLAVRGKENKLHRSQPVDFADFVVISKENILHRSQTSRPKSRFHSILL